MYPKLSALAGPVKGESFTLAEDSFAIGRQSSNQLSLKDTAVSRRHCLITATGEGHKLIDLESHNSTFINDVPVKERTLEHGDRIRVGVSLFVFLTHEDEAQPALQELNLDDQT
ncbi:MAG: FHA domain-containing protein, partial [Pyrinomonadaceae bacterium]